MNHILSVNHLTIQEYFSNDYSSKTNKTLFLKPAVYLIYQIDIHPNKSLS